MNHLALRFALEEREVVLDTQQVQIFLLRDRHPNDQWIQLECDRMQTEIKAERRMIADFKLYLARNN